MASIEKHISDLLCLHDCVIVPGLGGFVANYKAATAIEDRNLFLPPAKEIGFNRSLSHNDGLLINHIIKREGKTWEESSELINVYVKTLKQRIDLGAPIELNGIGAFRKDALGNFQFTPNERNQFLPDAFGLDEFHFEPLHNNASIARKNEEPVRRLLQSRSPRYWTSVAAMIAGLLLFSPSLDMPEHQKVETSNMLSAFAENSKKEVSSLQANEAAEDNALIIEAEKKSQPIETQGNLQATSDLKFHLIAASFKHEAPANQTLNAFKSDGFSEANLLHSENGRFRVALYSFANRDEAQQKLFSLRKNETYKNVWLLKE